MSLNTLQILDPTQYPGWDDLLLSTPGATFFHSSSWAGVLKDSYGYRPCYFASIDNGRLLALIAVMEVNSFLTGRRGVALPFTDYCDPIIDGGVQFQDLLDFIVKYGKKCGWRYFELRGGEKYLSGLEPPTSDLAPVFISYLGHTLDLSKGEDDIYSSFRESTKRNIKRATEEGITVEVCKSLESIKEFCRLNCVTRKQHGLPPQPNYFFEKIYDRVISKNLGFVALAHYRNKPIAGSVFFNFGEKAVYKYGASDKNYQQFRANNMVMWEAIKWHCRNHFKHFCFGRTEPEHQGLIQFKSGWGTIERKINYYQYDFKTGAFRSARSNGTGMHHKIVRKMPGPLLNWVGSFLYRHAG